MIDFATNSSGRGKAAQVPDEVRGWNWGAFLLNWVWGIGNSTYIALLMFMPLVNFVIPFVLGARGNEWAWRNRTWRSVEEFKATQRKWAWAGLIFVFVVIPGCLGFVGSALKNNDAYRLSLAAVQDNPEVLAELGQPLKPGFFVMGSINMYGPDGRAALQYSVRGSKGEGDVSVYAERRARQWKLRQVSVETPARRIVVVGEGVTMRPVNLLTLRRPVHGRDRTVGRSDVERETAEDT